MPNCLLDLLGHMCIVIICYPVFDVINFELTLAFLSSRFPTWLNSQDKNVNIPSTKGAFSMKQKAFFIIFKGLSVIRNCLRQESWPWKYSYKIILLCFVASISSNERVFLVLLFPGVFFYYEKHNFNCHKSVCRYGLLIFGIVYHERSFFQQFCGRAILGNFFYHACFNDGY